MNSNIELISSDKLYRRVHYYQIIRDNKTGELRPQSDAFSNTTGTLNMSVDIAKLRYAPEESLILFPDDSLVSFKIELATELNQDVIPDPIKENNAHANVKGEKNKRIRRIFAKKAEWEILKEEKK